MEIIILIIGLMIGLIIGLSISAHLQRRMRIFGYIEIDRNKGLCNVHMSSSEVQDPSIKYVVLETHHTDIDAPLFDSRNDQVL